MHSPLNPTVEFMMKAGQPIGVFPTDVKDPLRILRRKMLAGNPGGEVGEYLESEFANDLVGICDGLADSIIVAWGTLVTYVGEVAAYAILDEVNKSNLSKVGDDMIIDEFGKVQKPPSYRAPDIQSVLNRFNIHTDAEISGSTFFAFKEKHDGK